MTTICESCGFNKKNHYFKFQKNKYNICIKCGIINQKYIMKNKTLKLLKCSICEKFKLPSCYLDPNMIGPNAICKLCIIARYNLALVKYCHKTYFKLLKSINKYNNNANNNQKIIFNITYIDIINKYYQQNGLCFISNILMTYKYQQTKPIYKLYPKNIAIRLWNKWLGYTKNNIVLVCSSYLDEYIQKPPMRYEIILDIPKEYSTESIITGLSIQNDKTSNNKNPNLSTIDEDNINISDANLPFDTISFTDLLNDHTVPDILSI